jgi:hypothetical protein
MNTVVALGFQMVFASKRLYDSAQVFNPGNHPIKRFALKGRQINSDDTSNGNPNYGNAYF